MTSIDIPADERAWYAADKPMLVNNWLPAYCSGAYWATSSSSVTDATNASYPAARAYDGHVYLPTAPTGSSANWWFKVALSSSQIVDTIALR
jgi:hypothetical protein